MQNDKDNKGQTRPQDEGQSQKFAKAENSSENPQASSNKNVEGEGSYTASRNYRQGVEQTVKSGKVEEKAQEAKRAVEGPEGDALRDAERRGAQGPEKRRE